MFDVNQIYLCVSVIISPRGLIWTKFCCVWVWSSLPAVWSEPNFVVCECDHLSLQFDLNQILLCVSVIISPCGLIWTKFCCVWVWSSLPAVWSEPNFVVCECDHLSLQFDLNQILLCVSVIISPCGLIWTKFCCVWVWSSLPVVWSEPNLVVSECYPPSLWFDLNQILLCVSVIISPCGLIWTKFCCVWVWSSLPAVWSEPNLVVRECDHLSLWFNVNQI